MKLAAMVVLSLIGCAGSRGSGSGGSSGNAADETRGDAAKTICEAECHRGKRCHTENDSAACLARCGTLPVRNPAVWSASWASEVAACIEAVECAHDREEGCVFESKRHTATGDACLSSASGIKQQRRCAVLQGLTPVAEKQLRACLEAGGASECMPPYDWK